MLKILCCVKQVPDVDQMRMDPETGSLIRAGVPAILNPQDANALSAAMKVKETYGGEITLITMGPPNAEAVLRECLAVGADKAVLVTDRAFGNADTLATSYSILSAANTQGSYDMIFCGKESLDGATGQMGAQLAQRFGVSQVTGTLLIESFDEDSKKAVVLRELDDGEERLVPVHDGKDELPRAHTQSQGQDRGKEGSGGNRNLGGYTRARQKPHRRCWLSDEGAADVPAGAAGARSHIGSRQREGKCCGASPHHRKVRCRRWTKAVIRICGCI